MSTSADQTRIAAFHLMRGDTPVPAEELSADQKAAQRDIVTAGFFRPAGDTDGPYVVTMGVTDGRLVLAARNAAGVDLSTLVLSLKPYKRVIADYFLMIGSFEAARAEGNPAKLEAIDMGRRGLHNEGAELLIERLKDKVEIDFETGRRLFTLICALHRDHVRLS